MAESESTAKALAQFDPLLGHGARFAICALLSRTTEMSFSRFKELLQQTDGNLGAQLRALEDADYLILRRTFMERKPVTWYRLSAKGRRALLTHLKSLNQILAPPLPGVPQTTQGTEQKDRDLGKGRSNPPCKS